MKTYDYVEYKDSILKKRIYNLIEKCSIREDNKKIIRQYVEELEANGLKSSSIANRMYPIKKLATCINKNLKDAKKDDIIQYIKSLNNLNPRVRNIYKLKIKNFYKWINQQEGKKGLPECVEWIEVTIRNKTEKPKEILTKEEIKRLLDSMDHPRDKAVVILLVDSGCRIGEICDLKLKDVIFDEFGAMINVDGKTGERQIRLIESVPCLRTWINNHPFRDNPNSPLFFGRRKNYGEPLGYIGISDQIKKAAKLAGIKKKVNPHIFRHTKLTDMAKLLTDSELRIFAGWTKSSPMAAVYTHLNSNDVNNKILENKGIIVKEDKETRGLVDPIKCSRCNNYNSIGNSICEFCNQILDTRTAFSFDNNLLEENKKLNERLNVIENCLSQMLQTGNKDNIVINNQQVDLSVSGLQWNGQFIRFERDKDKA